MKIGQAVTVSSPYVDVTGAIVGVGNDQVLVELFPDSAKTFFDIYIHLKAKSKLKFTKRRDGSYRLVGFVTIVLHY